MAKQVAAEVERTFAADSDPKIEFDDPAEAEVHLVSLSILARDPIINDMTVPANFLHHPLVQDHYFCTLPCDFWGEVHNRVGINRFDAELVELEVALSNICGDHSCNAGFRNGRAFTYELRRRPLRVSLKDARATGIASNQAALDFKMRIAEERSSTVAKGTRAYSGWLMTNPLFLGELDALLETWDAMVRRWGFDRLGILLPRGMILPGDDPTTDSRWTAYHAAFEAFFVRWRLQNLAAPYLPIPVRPFMAGLFPASVLPQVMRSGGAFVIPDTFPIPSRDELRNILEDALHGSPTADHLDEWMEIIAKDNATKTPLNRFARLFEVQHYYRLLHQRHAAALLRKHSIVKDVLAKYLGTTRRTIDDDLKYINQRLGSDWVQRGGNS